MQERILKKFKKYVGKMFKNTYFYFWQILTCDTYIFQGLFKYLNVSPVPIIQIINHFWFFETPYPMHKKKFISKFFFTHIKLKQWRSFSILMSAVLKLFKKKHGGGYGFSPPIVIGLRLNWRTLNKCKTFLYFFYWLDMISY